MFDEPSDSLPDRAQDPAIRAREKADEMRLHAELAAVFEGIRKFDAQLRTDLNADVARDVQRRIGRLEKSKSPDSPVLPEPSAADAEALFALPLSGDVSTNDYHVYRRPGETMIIRWLEGEQVEKFYERFQAHFDVAIVGCREDERQALEWKQDVGTQEYLKALDTADVRVADRYLREVITAHHAFILSTLAVDEMDILHLCDYVMGVPAAEVVGPASAPPDEPTERDRAWFFKLFSLRGKTEGIERMTFFTYMQKAEDTFELDE